MPDRVLTIALREVGPRWGGGGKSAHFLLTPHWALRYSGRVSAPDSATLESVRVALALAESVRPSVEAMKAVQQWAATFAPPRRGRRGTQARGAVDSGFRRPRKAGARAS